MLRYEGECKGVQYVGGKGGRREKKERYAG